MLGIIAAGGLGVRMNSDTPKPLTLLPNGETFLSEAIRKLARYVDETVVVTSNAVLGHPSFVKSEGCHYRVQVDPTGMGDAVFTAGDLIKLHCDVLIIWCDQIGITEETIARSIASHKHNSSNRRMTIPLLLKSSRYIEFQISDGHLLRVRQAKEGDFVSDLAPSDIGLFIVSDGKEFFSTWLDGGREYSKGQITSEFNFLPFLEYLDSKGWVLNEVVAVESDGLGVNTQEELVQALRKLEK